MKACSRSRFFFIPAILFFAVITCGSAREVGPTGYRFRRHHVDDGLSENTIYCISQDSKGFLWFGTRDGLNRYDGRQFITYRREPNDPNSLGNNFIRSITHTNDGHMWVGTDAGVYLMDIDHGRFEKLNTVAVSGSYITSGVHAICIDRRSRVWFATNKEGLFMYDTTSGILHQYDAGNGKGPLPSNTVWSVFEDMSGTIWAGTREGMVMYTGHGDDFIIRSAGNTGVIGDDEIIAMTEDSEGVIWAGTWSGGLKRFDRRTGQYSTFFDRNSSLYISHIRTLFNYSPHQLMIGSDDGLYLYDKQTGGIKRIDRPGDPASLHDQNVYSIFRDREDGLWIGTYFGGVHYLVSENSPVETYSRGQGPGSITGNAVRQFCEDGQGNLWIATEDGGVNYFDTSTHTFQRDRLPRGLSYHNVHALLLDGEELWMGTFSRGIDIYNTRTGKTRHLTHNSGDTGSVNDNCIFSIYRSGDGTIWVGTPLGLNRYDRISGSFTRIETVPYFIYDIKEDTAGDLWVATYMDGIMRLEQGPGKWRHYRHIESDPASPPHHKIISILLDSRQQIWFTTEGGYICRYNKITDDFTTFNESDGLPNGVVYGMLEDIYGNLWLSSNKGITCFDPVTGHVIRQLTQADGLQSNEFNYKACYKAKDGMMYFGGINGFNTFYPDKFPLNPYAPPVVITSLDLHGTDDPALSGQIAGQLNNGTAIELPHNRSSFSVSFIALSFRAHEKNMYAYRMKGVDEKWNHTADQNRVTYINLPPGRYTFEVRAANNNGIWNEVGASVDFLIKPPWWGTILALVAYLTIFIGIAYTIIIYYIKRNREATKQKLQSYKAAQERANLASKINFFTSIAHEIRTPMSLIKAPLESISSRQKWDEVTRENLRLIERNAERLSELIDQLLDFRKLETANYTLKAADLDLRDFLVRYMQEFGYSARSRGIDFDFAIPDSFTPVILSDKDALQKVIGNLLSNAIKFTTDTIRVKAGYTHDGMYSVSVSDNGGGIPGRFKEKVFEPFFQVGHNRQDSGGTGIGLALARLMAEKLGGELLVADNLPSGTTFTFNFPPLPDQLRTTDKEQPAGPATAREEKQEGNPSRRRTILFADDNEDLRKYITSSFGDDFNIITASDGQGAMDIMKGRTIDLVISDVMMPGVDGFSFIRQLKSSESFCHIPVIMLSAKSALAFKVEGLEIGAEAFIEKPFSPSFLRAQVDTLLANRLRMFELFAKAPISMYAPLASNTRDRDFIIKLNNEIEKNISNTDFSVEALAERFHMSRSNLRRKLNCICGMAPVDYLRTYRLKKAAEMIATNKYRVNEVCYSVGFASPSYFSKCFMKQFGVLPKDFKPPQ